MTVTIYHNPACGTSRNTLAMIRRAGIEPMVIEYLKTPPSAAEILDIVKATGGTLRDLIRDKGTPYNELGLADPKWSDDDLLRFTEPPDRGDRQRNRALSPVRQSTRPVAGRRAKLFHQRGW
jgi:arsenate reductase (glutaredoxin)